MKRKILLVNLLFLMSINQLQAGWFDIQMVKDFCNNNQKYFLAAAGLGGIAIPSYLYLRKYLREKRISDLIRDHTERCNRFIGDNSEFKKFVDKFAPSADLQREFIIHEREIYEWPGIYSAKSEKVFVKGDGITRIINAERMRKIIQMKGLEHIDVPKKYIFLIGDQWTVFAGKVRRNTSPKNITLEEIKELVKVVKKTGYSDYLGLNLMRDLKGKLVFIDTEDSSFSRCSTHMNLRKLKNYIGSSIMEDALNWINEEIEKAPKDSSNSLLTITDLDDDIDVGVVKSYLRERNEMRFNTFFKDRAKMLEANNSWFKCVRNYLL